MTDMAPEFEDMLTDDEWIAYKSATEGTPILFGPGHGLVQMPNGDVITWEDYYLSTLDDRYNPEED